MLNRRNLLRIGVSTIGLLPLPVLAAGANKPAEGNYVATTQITGSLMEGTRAAGIMQVDATVYTVDPTLKQRLASSQPLIQSKWRNALQYYIANYYMIGNVPDANLIAALFQRAISAEIGQSRGRVLILSVIAR